MRFSTTMAGAASLLVPAMAQTTTTTISSNPVSTTSSYPAGSTLSNGGYVCNPGHSYGPSVSCAAATDGSGLYTLLNVTSATASTTSSYPAGSTLSNGGYVCNPAHSYGPSISCASATDGSGLYTLVNVTGSAAAATTTAAYSMPAGVSSMATGTTNAVIPTYTGSAAAVGIPTLGACMLGLLAFWL